MKSLIKTILFVLILLFSNTTISFAMGDETSTTIIGNGIGIGSALAIAICWTRTNSVITSIIAGFFGWLFVIYYLMIREKEEDTK